LPQIGVVAVMVSSVATTTHVYPVWLPPRSATMTGSALETTVLDSMATNIARRRPDMASSTSRCVIAGGSAWVAVGAVVVMARLP